MCFQDSLNSQRCYIITKYTIKATYLTLSYATGFALIAYEYGMTDYWTDPWRSTQESYDTLSIEKNGIANIAQSLVIPAILIYQGIQIHYLINYLGNGYVNPLLDINQDHSVNNADEHRPGMINIILGGIGHILHLLGASSVSSTISDNAQESDISSAAGKTSLKSPIFEV